MKSENMKSGNMNAQKPDLVKRCPACNEENPVSEVICRICMTNLASVSPTPRGAPVASALPLDKVGAGERKSAEPSVLTFSRLSDGRFVPVAGGGVLGRNGDAGEFFADFRTVSRRHAKVDFRGESWWIEDLNSTNGTWVNGSRLDPGRSHPLKKGDTVALSLACEMKVVS
jgi:hypothetical protein